MKILSIGGLVPWHPEAGGGQIFAYQLGKALSRAGHKVDYVAIAPREYQREVDWGHVIYSLESRSPLTGMLRALRTLRDANPQEYEVIHLHGANETVGYALGCALRNRIRRDAKFATQIHTTVYKIPRSWSEPCWRWACRDADLVFAPSNYSGANISQAYSTRSSKIEVTYAGVDSCFLSKEGGRAGRQDDRFSLLFCGRLNGPHREKGVDVLLKAMPFIVQKHNVVLRIAGTGPRVDEYKSLVESLGLAEFVRFLGFVEHGELPQIYSAADLVVVPSRRENFPLVCIEAMARCLPVVSTRAGGIPEVVEDGVTGVLVAPDNPHALAGAINSLLADRDRMKAMGVKGRERVEKYFTWDNVAERVLGGYHKIL